jgi:hypothetical protein
MLDNHMLASIDRVDFAQLGQRYLQRTQWRAWAADGQPRTAYTDKLPRNAMNVGFIHRALPGARILNVVRDPMDTCFSNLRELFGAAYPYSYDQRELAAHYRNHRKLMAHWHEVLPGRMLDVSYESLVADPEAVARQVFKFCGLKWVPGCAAIEKRSAPTATASTVQMRQPIDARPRGAGIVTKPSSNRCATRSGTPRTEAASAAVLKRRGGSGQVAQAAAATIRGLFSCLSVAPHDQHC